MNTALVISGGGSKGAFAVGALKSIFQFKPDFRFDIIVGTSTGSLIAPLAAFGKEKIDVLEQLYTTVTTADIIDKGNLIQRFMNGNALFDSSPLAALLRHYYNDDFFAELCALPVTLLFATVCLQTEQTVYFSTKRVALPISGFEVKELQNGDQFRRALMASASQPGFMSPIEIIPGQMPVRQYGDGGVREYAGVEIAIKRGAAEIFAILLSPAFIAEKNDRYTDVANILLRTIEIFSEDVGVNDIYIPQLYADALQYIDVIKSRMENAGLSPSQIEQILSYAGNPFAGKKPVNIHLIRPAVPLGGGQGGLEFNIAEMKGMVAKGNQYMQDYIAALKPGDSILV